MSKTYAIFYGWLSDGPHGEPNADAQRIARASVPLLIASYWTEPRTHRNLSPQVLALMRDAGTRVFAYVSTRWGAANLASVKAQVAEYIDRGVDGIFLDEGHNFLDGSKLLYYRAIAQLAQRSGKEVIANPGVACCGEDIMSIADFVMLEHDWRNLPAQSRWTARYPPERFMGVSSNEESGMGYRIDVQRAIADTRQAWASGIGWHASTDRYTRVPEWFEEYIAAVGGGER